MQNGIGETWWSRPCGGRDVLRLAMPLVISTGSWTLMNFTDRMFLLWHSTKEMAAAMPAGMLYFTVVCFPLGVVSYTNTFVAQYYGAGRKDRIGRTVWQGLRISLWSIPLILATIPLAPCLFSAAGHERELAGFETVYYQLMATGSGGVLVSATLSSFFTGRGSNRVVMIVDTAGALLNVVLDYLWIFGHWGFPEMGIAGAALATSVAQWSQALLYWAIMHQRENVEVYGLIRGRQRDPELMRRLWWYGGPNGLQMLVEVAGFTLFLLFVARLGTQATAATTLAFNINSMAFVPMFGVGMAVSTMVGQQLGGGRPDLAGRAAWTGFAVAELYMGTFAVLYVLTPDLFLFGHAAGTDPAEFAGLRQMTVVLLRFVAAYCVLDAMNVVFSAVMKGAGDTRFILATTLVMSSALVLAVWAGMAFWGLGVLWCWTVVTAWVCALGLIYQLRFLQGHWRSMRVIEAALPSKDQALALEGLSE